MFIILLALLGLALIYTEFFLPGGILAVIGSISLLASIILCFMHASTLWGSLYILFLILAVIGICKLALWKMRRSKIKDRFYLEKDQEGFLAASFDQTLIGKTGTVFTELKPAGHILIEGTQYQALSEAGFLSKGETVEVVGGQGSHLIVRTTIKRTS
ncbi:MAG: NfeD family protein [Verrucomicrobia bacterium]|nr:NfeD family protein [Verrucomicrobiota bacterium]